MVVEVLEVQRSAAFELCIDEELIEFWWDDIMFESPHDTIFGRMSTLQWCRLLFIWNHSGIILRLWWILLVWWVFRNFNLIHHLCNNCCEVYCRLLHFLIIIFPVGLNFILNDELLVIWLVIHLVLSTWNLEALGMKGSITEIGKWLWKFGAILRRWALMSEQPGEIRVFSTWFGLRKFWRLGVRV